MARYRRRRRRRTSVSLLGPLMRPYKRTRNTAYRMARVMGNIQPWLELSPRKLARRYVYRKLGKWFSGQCFGRGIIGKTVRGVLGL